MARLDNLRPKNVFIDAAVVALAVGGANWIIAQDDPGWISLNPSPYLLLPLLIGARYGFGSGIAAGASACLLVALQQSYTTSLPIRLALTQSVYLYISFLFIGGIAGELYSWLHRERTQSETQLDKIQASAKNMDAEIRYLRTMKDDYDQAVAASGGQISTLDTELRRLHTYSAEDLPGAVLQLLKRQLRVSDAAIYSYHEDPLQLTRLAMIGKEGDFPEHYTPGNSRVVELSIKHKSLVTLPQLLERTEPPEGERVLLALPLNGSKNRPVAYLFITGIPFISFTQQSTDLITLIGNWAGELLELTSGAGQNYRISTGQSSQRVYHQSHFEHLIELTYKAYTHHHLSSTIVIFRPPSGSHISQTDFELPLLKAVRSGDFVGQLEIDSPNLAVLLPLVGLRGTEIFISRAQKSFEKTAPASACTLQVETLLYSQQKDLSALLQRLTSLPPSS